MTSAFNFGLKMYLKLRHISANKFLGGIHNVRREEKQPPDWLVPNL